MKIFFGAVLGFLAAIVVAAGVLVLARSEAWPRRASRAFAMGLPERTQPSARVDRRAFAVHADKRRNERELDEWQEQRRERLTLLSATLGVEPVARLNKAEKQLFQEAERKRGRSSADAADRSASIRLIAPVQIDEWTVLPAGTPVEFVRYERDNVVTVRSEAASYQVSPCQTELRTVSGDVCNE